MTGRCHPEQARAAGAVEGAVLNCEVTIIDDRSTIDEHK